MERIIIIVLILVCILLIGGKRFESNKNPWGMKIGSATQYLIDQGFAEIGTKAKDGGRFLRFKSEEVARQAAEYLLHTCYGHLSVDAAMKRWSNGGYDGDIAPEIKYKFVKHLLQEERDLLLNVMKRMEGYKK